MSLDLPGFADPVLDAQSCFRSVLDAMSRPGTVHPVGGGLTPPAPLSQAAAAVLLTLADAETALHLAEGFEPARDWIGFHCGTRFAIAPGAADFVLAACLPELAGLGSGSDDEPEGGATVILQVRAIGEGRRFILSGPGLREAEGFAVDGLPDPFLAAWEANHALYPRGVDLILCAGDRLAAFPRSLSIAAGDV